MPLDAEQVKTGLANWLVAHYPDNADSLYNFFFGLNPFINNEVITSAALRFPANVVSDDQAASITSDCAEVPLYQLLKGALPPTPDQADTAKQMADAFVNSFFIQQAGAVNKPVRASLSSNKPVLQGVVVDQIKDRVKKMIEQTHPPKLAFGYNTLLFGSGVSVGIVDAGTLAADALQGKPVSVNDLSNDMLAAALQSAATLGLATLIAAASGLALLAAIEVAAPIVLVVAAVVSPATPTAGSVDSQVNHSPSLNPPSNLGPTVPMPSRGADGGGASHSNAGSTGGGSGGGTSGGGTGGGDTSGGGTSSGGGGELHVSQPGGGGGDGGGDGNEGGDGHEE